jgi:hypothetical protein
VIVKSTRRLTGSFGGSPGSSQTRDNGDVLTGFLLLLVVAGWAAYLVPYCLHRYDSRTEMKSIQGFSTAMRVLSRRTTADA